MSEASARSLQAPAKPRVAVVGGGWAGLAAAIAASQGGASVHLFEAAPQWGGRARRLGTEPGQAGLDNGQHILIGAYAECLRLMRLVGVSPEQGLLRLPLSLRFPDGQGLRLPAWPAPLDAVAGILGAVGWSWADRLSLLRATLRWQWGDFECPASLSVLDLCQGIRPRVMADLLEPLCVSALNTPIGEASGQVFLRVLRDALAGPSGSSHLLLPRTDLSALWPEAAARWLQVQGHSALCSHRVHTLRRLSGGRWQLDLGDTVGAPATEAFDQLILACPPGEASRLLEQAQGLADGHARPVQRWVQQARALRFEAIATVYAQAPGLRLPAPLLALRPQAEAPAQFVFDRGQLGGSQGLLALVVSASSTDRELLTQQVLRQARAELSPLGLKDLHWQQTVVEKRATFACTPGLQRPSQAVLTGLQACGDYCAGPYPATLEGAVLSGSAAGRAAALGLV
ncbi:hydroxysqualene dehydroxylase HpnE [Curvibacter sp. RS43]|uniref:hydroxysqualene dehydroxylase HpnE n=1 Tax=Curvibacter microcysteis TaxID=3026419 RepID=UPI0023621151|nr:hydroxysqualene dehydroxylase HpnE [Curvibacter sp. RS43]MDD0809635.1 hydroxysqualene dehydroxylase HpnE [Curvibacter sp. RS43]